MLYIKPIPQEDIGAKVKTTYMKDKNEPFPLSFPNYLSIYSTPNHRTDSQISPFLRYPKTLSSRGNITSNITIDITPSNTALQIRQPNRGVKLSIESFDLPFLVSLANTSTVDFC